MNIEQAVQSAIDEYEADKFRKSVRGLLTKTLLKLGVPYSQAKCCVSRYVVDYKIPCGMTLPGYVSTLAYKVMNDIRSDDE